MTDSFLPSEVLQYCPFCGAPAFFEYNYLRCRTCNQKLYINESAAVACVITNNCGEILLTRRKFDPSKGMLDLPGGFVDIGEAAEDAVRREIMEELNLQVDALHYFCSRPNRYLYGGIIYHTLDLGFRCTVADFSNLKANDDVSGFIFLSPQKIDLNQICFPSIRGIIQDYIRLFQ